MSEKIRSDYWDKTITSDSKLFSLNVKSIWEYRDLVFLLVKRDFITYYKQTVFGPLWYLVQPIMSAVMYMIIFGALAKLGTDGIPQFVFYFSGTMLWTYFSSNLKSVSNTFFQNKDLFGKVFFPRLVAPIATTIGLLIKFGIQFALFILVYIFYVVRGMNVNISWVLLLFPFSIVWLSMLSCGIGMVVSAITTKYRDIAMVLEFLISLWMYATPIVYPLSEVPNSLLILACINPVSAPVEIFRLSFFGVSSVPLWAILCSLIMTAAVFILGLIMFSKNERTFVDVI